MKFIKRLTEPSVDDKYWIHTSKGGLNSCVLISRNSVLSNCVGYAWGRFYELIGSKPKLSRGNAETWYNYNDGYKRGKTPKLGAVACWSKGSATNSKDGAGHVAIVEEIKSDGTIITSNSQYKGQRFLLRELKPPYDYNGLTFQGFIYCPIEFDEDVVQPTAEYISGIYQTQANMRIRKGPGTNYPIAKVKECTKQMQNALTSKVLTANAVVEKGRKITALKIIKNGSQVWMKNYSGYICIKGTEEYCKFVK